MQCKVSIKASNNKEITQQQYKGPGKRKNRKQEKRVVKKRQDNWQEENYRSRYEKGLPLVQALENLVAQLRIEVGAHLVDQVGSKTKVHLTFPIALDLCFVFYLAFFQLPHYMTTSTI